jgi:hypothetical protein
LIQDYNALYWGFLLLQDGRTAYHYTPMCKDVSGVQKLLINAGADSSIVDSKQHSAKYYTTHVQELELPNSQKSTASSSKSAAHHESKCLSSDKSLLI